MSLLSTHNPSSVKCHAAGDTRQWLVATGGLLWSAAPCCHSKLHSYMWQRTLADSAGARRASFDGRHTMRLQRGSAIRCTTSKCALPMVSLGYLDRDW